MIEMNRQISTYRDVKSSLAGTHVESVSEHEEDTQETSARNLSYPGGHDEISHGRNTMKPHGSRHAHGFFAQPVVVPQTDSKLSFVVLIGSTLLPAANLVHRASPALRLTVSSS